MLLEQPVTNSGFTPLSGQALLALLLLICSDLFLSTPRNILENVFKISKSSATDKELVDNVLRCIEMVKLKHDGQYIENIASACADQLEWDRPKIVAGLRKAVELEAIREVIIHGKTSYRCILPTKNGIIRGSDDVNKLSYRLWSGWPASPDRH